MPHSNERVWVKFHILCSAVLRRGDRFVRTDCYNCAVSLFYILKHPSAPPLPAPTSLVLALPFAYFPFFALCSHPFLFFSFSPSLAIVPIAYFICYSLNHGGLMSFALTFFSCQCLCTSPPRPNCASISFKALITRPSSTLETPSSNVPPVQTNLISCFIRRDFCSNHRPYLMLLSRLRVGQRH